VADPDILRAVAVCAELTGTELSEAAARIFAEDLAAYPKSAVLHALERCRREVRGRLVLADVLVTAGPYGCAHLIRGLLRVALPALVVIRLAFFAGFGLDRGVGWRRFWRSSSSLRSHQEAVALPFFLLFASVCRKPIASFAELKGP